MEETRIQELFYDLYSSSKQHDSWHRYAMIRELRELMKQPKGGSDHFERFGDDRRIDGDDRRFGVGQFRDGADDDEEQYLVMDEELAEIEDRAVENETNPKMISAIDKEEPIPQLQVHVSKLEPSLQFHNASSDICDDVKSSLFGHQEAMLQVSHVEIRDELLTKSTDVTNNQAAHYLFDKMPLRMQSKRRHIKCHKSWRFKFKHRVASREFKAGFEVNMKYNRSKEMLLQLLLSGTHKKRQRKTPKYHKTWKFRFKNMELQRIVTQLDTQHCIFRWDSFGVDVIICHGEQQLECRVVMLHFKNKGRFRRFQSSSRLNNAQRILIVSQLERKKKTLCYKTWMFKYKVDEEDQRNLQSGTEHSLSRREISTSIYQAEALLFGSKEPAISATQEPATFQSANAHGMITRGKGDTVKPNPRHSLLAVQRIWEKETHEVDIIDTNSVLQEEFEQVVNHTLFFVIKLEGLLLLSDESFQIKHKWRFKLLPLILECDIYSDRLMFITNYAQQFDTSGLMILMTVGTLFTNLRSQLLFKALKWLQITWVSSLQTLRSRFP